jgi:phage gp36-like protein
VTGAVYAEPEQVRAAVARDPGNAAGTAGSMADSQLQESIDNAQAEIDARLRGRYTVPFAAVPLLIHTITVEIAAYHAKRRYRQSKPLNPEDPAVLGYQWAQNLLKQIANGDADLDDGTGTGASEPAGSGGGLGRPVNAVPGRLFSMDEFDLGHGRPRRRHGWGDW